MSFDEFQFNWTVEIRAFDVVVVSDEAVLESVGEEDAYRVNPDYRCGNLIEINTRHLRATTNLESRFISNGITILTPLFL